MSLINWKDVNDRYPETLKLADATQADSSWVPFAIAELHARLSPGFTVPFSDNNMTAKDLAIDLTFAKLYRFKDIEKADAVMTYVGAQIDMLLAGSQKMITSSGDTLAAVGGTIYHTNDAYHPVHGMGPIEYAIVSSAEVIAEQEDRGVY
ncbi:MAG: hypothetical protein ACYCZR_07025 [Burkholderiales bacterium]